MESGTDLRNDPAAAAAEPLETVLLRAILEESSGRVVLPGVPDWGPLFLRRGRAFLSKARALAMLRLVKPEELEVAGELPGIDDPGKRRLLLALLKSIAMTDRMACLLPGGPPESAAPFVGPLPTRDLAQEIGVYGWSRHELLRRLGGEGQWLQTVPDAPALAWLPALEPKTQRWLSRFADGAPLGEVVLGAKDPLKSLREIGRLRTLELLAPRVVSGEPDSEEIRRSEGRTLVPGDTLARLMERIEESLAEEPLDVPADDHRARVAEMIAESGGATHYELLGVGFDLPPDDVIGPYRKLARLVHPDHAAALSLVGGEIALRVLFERATLAYLVLSDPDRRKRYDGEQETTSEVFESRTEAEIAESRQVIARRSYREAKRQLQSEDYHYAYEHCQIAVKNDPQPEYYALLGEIQSHNPKWLPEAANSLSKALELKPKEPMYLYQLAEIYEKMENDQAAVRTYEAVLEGMPNHPGAIDALERLGAAKGSRRSRSGDGEGSSSWIDGLLKWFSGG